ncbi:MAG: hypothetical protein E6Q97_15610 [Desulfurellales bacterium]|nr:MAG: hypothetical protein E6Q97_15610 [Desulfurellales bacterium]
MQFTSTKLPYWAAIEAQIAAQLPAIDALAEAFPALSTKDQSFAESLLRASKKGPLSEKQMHWVGVLTQRATSPVAVKERVDLSRVVNLFTQAGRAGLKNPSIRIGGVKLSPAKVGSANYGSVYVKAGSTYLGKISGAGDWSPARDAGQAAADAFAKVQKFACDPVSAASAEGHATGDCCFCGKELSDAGSIAVGYGPICAENYGLPHSPAGRGLKVSVSEAQDEDYNEAEDGYGAEERAVSAAEQNISF